MLKVENEKIVIEGSMAQLLIEATGLFYDLTKTLKLDEDTLFSLLKAGLNLARKVDGDDANLS